jgi:hypothetical protein
MTHKTLIKLIILLFVFSVFFVGSKNVVAYGGPDIQCYGSCLAPPQCSAIITCPDDRSGYDVYCKGTGLYCGAYWYDPCQNEVEECGYAPISCNCSGVGWQNPDFWGGCDDCRTNPLDWNNACEPCGSAYAYCDGCNWDTNWGNHKCEGSPKTCSPGSSWCNGSTLINCAGDGCGQSTTDCGTDYWTNEYRCVGTMQQRKYVSRGCSGSSCYSNEIWSDWSDCGSDYWTNNYSCNGDWRTREYISKGCSGTSCYGPTSSYPNWEDCNTYDGWYGSELRNYYCSSGSCVYTGNTPPTCTPNAPPHNTWINYNPTFNATVSDVNNENVRAYFSVNGYGDGWGNWVGSGQLSAWGSLNLGTCFSNWWRCYAQDIRGLTGAWSGYWLANVDTSLPTTTISYPPGPLCATTINPITISGADACSGVASNEAQISINGGAWTPWAIAGSYVGEVGSCYKFRARTRDNANNWSAWTEGGSTCIETTPTADIKANGSDGPITILPNTAANLTWTSTRATSCTASGDWSGAKALSGSESTGNLTSSKTYTLTCSNVCGSGQDSVTVIAGFDFSISASPASGSIHSGSSVASTITVTKISGSASAVAFTASGLPAGANASFGPASCTPNNSCTSTMTITTTHVTTPIGSHGIVITGTGGGVTQQTNYTLSITNNAPTCTLNAPPHNTWLNASMPNPTFSAVGTDPDGDQHNAYFEINGYGSGWGGLANSGQLSAWGPLNLGTCFSNWWRCFDRDVHGGDSAWTGYWLANVDRDSPTANISYPTGTMTPQTITITQTESDACSGIASGTTYYRSWDLGAAEPGTWSPYTTGIADFTFAGVANKCYRWEYMVTDNAGNSSAWAVGGAVCFPYVSCDIKANGSDGPLSVYYGASANLTWSSFGAISCTASNAWSGVKATSGSETTGVLTALSQTYTITCDGPGGRGRAICNDSVTVTIPPPPTNPVGNCPNPGSSATISWTPAPGYTHHYVRVYNTPVVPPPVFYNDDYVANSYTFASTQGATYTWWVHTRDAVGNYSVSVGGSFTCGMPVPTVDIKARTAGSGTYSDGPIDINNNTAVDLQWTSTNATSCTASVDWSGAKATSGTETTGNLTGNKTYTITCNGIGGNASDTVLVNIGTLSVVLTANKTSGNAPLTGVQLTATVSGTTTGTINYTFYCNRADTGTNITVPNSHKLDGTSATTYSTTPLTVCDSTYAVPGTYYAKVIVERGNSATTNIPSIPITVNVPPNQAPTATNPTRTNSSFCTTAPSYFFSWEYADSDGDTELEFDFEVDNNSNFLSPEVSRTVTNPPSTTNTQSVILATNQGSDNITYGTPYYWRARVYDEHGLVSGWLTGIVDPPFKFTTPAHHYPDVDFTWVPNMPNVGEIASLSDTSTCYDEYASGSDCSTTKGESYLWTMTGGTPNSATTENTATKYSSPPGPRNVTLQVTDSDGHVCSTTKTINVNYPLPTWREIRPF